MYKLNLRDGQLVAETFCDAQDRPIRHILGWILCESPNEYGIALGESRRDAQWRDGILSVYVGAGHTETFQLAGNRTADYVRHEPIAPPQCRTETRYIQGRWEKRRRGCWVSAS
jgi:hypothetical protein